MTAFADDADRIGFFFDDPNRSPSDHTRAGACSVLYLLRRELIETLGYDSNTTSESEVDRQGSRHRLFASLILMFTTVDLLAKFMFGDTGGVGDRFRRFLQSPDGGALARLQADLLWLVRNSLVHAFGLPDPAALSRLGVRAVGLGQRKTVGGAMPSLIEVEQQLDVAVVYVDGLYRLTIGSIRRYEDSLSGTGTADGRAAFNAAFQTYGLITMR